MTLQTPPHIALKKLRDSLQNSGGVDLTLQLRIQIAHSCRDSWRICWDTRSDSQFYFNTITGTRQRQIPEALLVSQANARNPMSPVTPGNVHYNGESNIDMISGMRSFSSLRSASSVTHGDIEIGDVETRQKEEQQKLDTDMKFRKKRYRLLVRE